MRPLSTGLKARQTLLDGPLNQTVITEFKVEKVVLLAAAPVTAVEVRPFLKVQRARDRCTVFIARQYRHLSYEAKSADDKLSRHRGQRLEWLLVSRFLHVWLGVGWSRCFS